jgi:predicted nucleotidyltransferase
MTSEVQPAKVLRHVSAAARRYNLAEAGPPSEPADDRGGCVSEGGSPDAKALREIVQRIVEVAHPDRIILFGSAARGEMGPDSDIDVLVVKHGVPHRRRLEGEIYMNLRRLGVGVDVVVATPEDVEYLKNRAGSIIGPALREGREIYAAATRPERSA